MFNLFGNIVYFAIVLLMIIAYYLAYQQAKRQSDYYRPFRTTAGAIVIIVLVLHIARSIFLFLPRGGFLGLLIAISINIMFLSVVFPKLERRFPFVWLRYFFHIGIFLTILVSDVVDSYPMSLNDAVGASFGIFCFELIGISGVIMIAFLASLLSRTPMPQTYYKAHARHDKMATYREAGMSEQEITFFREQMATAKEQILIIEREFNRTAKLKAIETRHNTVKVAQNFFKEIVQEPQQLSSASSFLYKLLPSLKDLLEKYNEINGHVAKNKQTYLILEKSGATIEKVCEQINDAYIQFHQADYDEMLDEINLASRNFERHDTSAKSENSVDDLLQDAFN